MKSPAWNHVPLPNSGEGLNSVAISGDGSKVVAGTYFYTAGTGAAAKNVGFYVYDHLGKPVGTPDIYLATYGVTWVAVSRNGSWAASGGQVSTGTGLINAYQVSTGHKLLTHNTPAMVNMVALDGNGSVLVAGSDLLYVFARKGSTHTWAAPQTISYPGAAVERVAISGDGKWIVAAVAGGVVSLIPNQNGVLGPAANWSLPTGWALWIDIAEDGSSFAAAGSNGIVYYFNIKAFAALAAPVLQPAWQAILPGCKSCRSVAVCGDGSLISAVGDFNASPTTGRVFLLSNQGNSAKQLWTTVPTTLYGTNSTSIDSKGKYLTATDGTPAGTAGNFYLFNASNGSLVWSYKTPNMNWPMQISANASAAAAGSDSGDLYYFSVP